MFWHKSKKVIKEKETALTTKGDELGKCVDKKKSLYMRPSARLKLFKDALTYADEDEEDGGGIMLLQIVKYDKDASTFSNDEDALTDDQCFEMTKKFAAKSKEVFADISDLQLQVPKASQRAVHTIYSSTWEQVVPEKGKLEYHSGFTGYVNCLMFHSLSDKANTPVRPSSGSGSTYKSLRGYGPIRGMFFSLPITLRDGMEKGFARWYASILDKEVVKAVGGKDWAVRTYGYFAGTH
jgi:hypothetical protein